MTHWLRWAVAVLILGGLAYQLARLAGQPLSLAALDPLLIAAALVPGSLAFVAFAWSWIALSGARNDWPRAGNVWFSSLLARYLPGGIWQGAVRAADAGTRGGSVTGALVQYGAEQALACASAAILSLALASLGPALPPPVTTGLMAVALLGIVAPFLFARFAPRVRWNTQAAVAMAVGHLLLVVGFATFAGSWQSLTIARALAFAQAFLVAGLAGVLAVVVPAGLGVREGVLAWLLLPHFAPAEALAIALASRAWSIACEAIAWGGWMAATAVATRARSP